MTSQPYEYSGPIDCSIAPDKTQCKGKSVIVTGGANGLGEAYVRAFVDAGAFVTFCDIDEERGKAVESDLTTQNVCFVKCDTRSWEDQVQLFEAAVSKSPHKSVDIVIANAGVGRGSGDPMMNLEDPFSTPTKPSMHIIDINLIGTMMLKGIDVSYDIGSIAGIVDNLSSWEYSVSKFGLRGLMRTVRRQSYHQGIRVAYIAPYYVRTVIQSAATYEGMRAKGIEFATVDSCVAAIMRVACDKEINGHSLAIVPYSIAKEGFKDAEEDDWIDEDYWLQKFQRLVVTARGDGWN